MKMKIIILLTNLLLLFATVKCQVAVLTPPYLTISGENLNITASATCGEDHNKQPFSELYCKLAGANVEEDLGYQYPDRQQPTLILGQWCDICEAQNATKMHPARFAIDGKLNWWQSPPLSRNLNLENVTLTIDLNQEFQIAYIYIRMANSPRPALWVLERSKDYGASWDPWYYFAESRYECEKTFQIPADQLLTSDDQISCTTKFGGVNPVEGGEIIVELIKNRPGASNFSQTPILQDWTTATNIRMRLLKTNTLRGHLMAKLTQDPTITRRYYYSIRDIEISGRCVCNGHSDECHASGITQRLVCNCRHNTCGDRCDSCCPGYVAKTWRKSTFSQPFQCEECQCYGHSNECTFNQTVADLRLSTDLSGNKDGGGQCGTCYDNTEGINCELCQSGHYRPGTADPYQACISCGCPVTDLYSGDCEDGSGRCLCRVNFLSPDCIECAPGYHSYPACLPCECDGPGAEPGQCQVVVKRDTFCRRYSMHR